ncbi:MAG: hypothetical protein B6I25_01595 [Planctomycetales bacterium 4572_13]|nr:MAG: hypothetical protein B6I25_01595 [Planctomycetales bacterium 4572_13]
MKLKRMFVLSLIVAVSLSLCGCQEEQADTNTLDTDAVNKKIVDTYSDLAIQNAIIAQHTLYPYHFVNNSAQLNGLGERDLTVLVQHFQDNPGQLILQQGGTESLLYQSRAQTIYEKLLVGGIPDEKIRIADGAPGGDGIASNAIIEILATEKTTDMSQGFDMEVAF